MTNGNKLNLINIRLPDMIKMRVTLLVLLLIVFSGSKPIPEGTIKWITFEEAIELSKSNPRKLLIDIYTDWCGWCKKMDQDTYANPKLASYINENYYAVKFNAEQREDIVFDGHTFKFIPNGSRGVHQLAAALTNNQLSYPTTVFMNEKLEILQPIPGYMNAKSIEPILFYFGEDKHKSVPWEEYQAKFKSSL